jgi:hypothetical protein
VPKKVTNKKQKRTEVFWSLEIYPADCCVRVPPFPPTWRNDDLLRGESIRCVVAARESTFNACIVGRGGRVGGRRFGVGGRGTTLARLEQRAGRGGGGKSGFDRGSKLAGGGGGGGVGGGGKAGEGREGRSEQQAREERQPPRRSRRHHQVVVGELFLFVLCATLSPSSSSLIRSGGVQGGVWRKWLASDTTSSRSMLAFFSR